MRTILGIIFAMLTLGVSAAQAQLVPFKDYEISDAVWSMSTIKVDPNAGDRYLEGLKSTWVAAAEIQKELGHIEDYAIYGSVTPQNGDFNLILLQKYKSIGDMAPSEEKYDAFVKAFGKARLKQSDDKALNTYPELREITGDYILHKLTIK